MPCYKPLDGYVVGIKENGKKLIKFGSPPVYSKREFERIEVPCGQCIGCRLEYSRQWANRCMLELPYHKSSYFVTLTYSPEHIEHCLTYHEDPETGEAIPAYSLVKRDFQLFMKRLRKAHEHRYRGRKLRFFASGEYGEESFRPHFHAIIFGLILDDLTFYKRSKLGYTYYNSPWLESLWPYGYVVVGECNWETCAYTARYVMKKATGKNAEFYSTFNIEPEFSLMSRRPGIARQYFEDHPEVMSFDDIHIPTPKGGKSFKPPRYYRQLFDVIEPEESEKMKEVRKATAIASQALKLSKTDLDIYDLRKVEEQACKDRLKGLERKLV